MPRFAVWGSEAAEYRPVREGVVTNKAWETAIESGFEASQWPEPWAVEVEIEEDVLDQYTRFDPNVLGWDLIERVIM